MPKLRHASTAAELCSVLADLAVVASSYGLTSEERGSLLRAATERREALGSDVWTHDVAFSLGVVLRQAAANPRGTHRSGSRTRPANDVSGDSSSGAGRARDDSSSARMPARAPRTRSASKLPTEVKRELSGKAVKLLHRALGGNGHDQGASVPELKWEGQVYKAGSNILGTHWKRRYLQVDGLGFRYSKARGEEALGSVAAAHISEVAVESEKAGGASVHVFTDKVLKDRVYQFRVGDVAEARLLEAAFASVIERHSATALAGSGSASGGGAESALVSKRDVKDGAGDDACIVM